MTRKSRSEGVESVFPLDDESPSISSNQLNDSKTESTLETSLTSTSDVNLLISSDGSDQNS